MRSTTSVSGITSRREWMNISAGNRLSCRIPADRLWLITNGLWVLSFVARLPPPSVWRLIAYPRLSRLSTDGLTITTSCSNCRSVGVPSPVAGVIGPPSLRMSSGVICVTVVSCAGSGCRAAVCSASVLSVCFMVLFLDGNVAKAVPFPMMTSAFTVPGFRSRTGVVHTPSKLPVNCRP